MRTRYLTPGEAASVLHMTRSGVVWLLDTRQLRGTRTATGRRLVSVRSVEKLAHERELRETAETR